MSPEDLGAVWTLEDPDGGTQTGSANTIIEGLSAGDYTLSWGAVADWIAPTPNPARLTLVDGESGIFTGAYVPDSAESGSISIDPNPDSLRAPWTISGPSGFSASGEGDQFMSSAAVGEYVLSWGEVLGYVTPAPETLSLADGQSISFSANYDAEPTAPRSPAIPSAAEWTDHGDQLFAGSDGDWDLYLWGGFGASVVKVGPTFHLYYQGSDGYDDVGATVTHRGIGVATSSDGIHFSKVGLEPVLSWLPTNGLEEGAASIGAWTDANGDVQVYYGANTAISSTEVNADGRKAWSSDGLSFQDEGIVLDHRDNQLWGSGDEIFPILGFEAEGKWISYYLPNGSPQSRTLGVAWGASATNLNDSAGVQVYGAEVRAWGPAGWAKISDSAYTIFVSNDADTHAGGVHMDVYLMNPTAPSVFVGPVQSYEFPNANRGTVYLDLETETWFFYYRNADASAYGVRTAPVRWE